MTDEQTHEESAEGRAQILLWVMPAIAAVLLPGLLWLVAERPLAARFRLALAMTLIVAFVALVFFAIYSRGFRHRIRWSLALTAITTLVAFQWPTLSTIGELLADRLPIPMLSDLFPVVAAIAFLWIATRIGHERPYAIVTTAGLWLLVVALAAGTVSYATLPEVPDRSTTAAAGSPDVLIVVMDGYARGDTLETEFGYDNSPFLTSLEDLGFVVADLARSNYNFTFASVATMLEMDYIYDLGEISPSEKAAVRNALAGDPAVMTTFRDHGYEVAFVENAWAGSRCSPLVDVCIRDGIFERAMWNIGRVTILAPLASAVRGHPFNTVSRSHLESLPEIVDADRTDGTPRLTIAHILLPHPPFLLDEACRPVSSPVRRDFMTQSTGLVESRRQFYTEQLTCTNSILLESLEQIIAEHEDTVVMITGDHGSALALVADVPASEWSGQALSERLSILSAYRMPGCEDSVYPSITPVNGVRAITACSLEIDLDRLPDWSWWVPGDGDGFVTDQSDRLRH